MNDKEISEIRRRLRPDKNNIGRVRGCYVNEKKLIISEFDQMLGMISADESEELLSFLRRVFSGSIGRNLLDIEFATEQVLNSDEHKLLSALRSTSLSDSDAVHRFFEKAIPNIDIEGNFFILLASDKYDIFTPYPNGEKDGSTEMFSYIVCAVCPLKTAKPTLGYNLAESKFKNILRDSVLTAPELGFMFPAFEDNGANIYKSLFYTRDISLAHKEFRDAVFNAEVAMTATEQTESITSLLRETVADDCSLEFVQAVQGQLIELVEDHKASKEVEPLKLSSNDMGSLLRFGGVSEETIGTFTEKFETEFGNNASVAPANVMDIKKLEIKTPNVVLKVKPEFGDNIKTQVIDGTKYIMIRADGDIEVNGIKIDIK